MIKEMFSDSNGLISSMRVNNFIMMIFSLALSGYATYAGKITEVTPLVISILGISVGGKVFQKFAEKDGGAQ